MPTSSREDFVNGLLGVGMLDAEWQTERFLAEERRSLSQTAALAEGARVDEDTRIEVVTRHKAGQAGRLRLFSRTSP